MPMSGRKPSKHRTGDGTRLDLRLSHAELARIRADAAARQTEAGEPLTMAAWVRDRLGLEPAPRLWIATTPAQKEWPKAEAWIEARDNADGTVTLVNGRTQSWLERQPYAFVASAPPPAEAIRYAGGQAPVEESPAPAASGP